MSKVLVVSDDRSLHQTITDVIKIDGHIVTHVPDITHAITFLDSNSIDLAIIDQAITIDGGLDFLDKLKVNHPTIKTIVTTEGGDITSLLEALRKQVCDFIVKPIKPADLRVMINSTLEEGAHIEIQIVSTETNWVQLRVPCNPAVVPILQKLLTQISPDINDETKETIGLALREMLNNAIEHGGKFDHSKFVEISAIRLKRAVMYWIKDPGEGFDPAHLEHAAVNNPATEPFRHVLVRDEKGLRAGGFGILLTNQLVDELVYNESRNEVMFIKYI